MKSTILTQTKIMLIILKVKWSRVAIQKWYLNSGQIDVISVERFSLSCRCFSRGTPMWGSCIHRLFFYLAQYFFSYLACHSLIIYNGIWFCLVWFWRIYLLFLVWQEKHISFISPYNDLTVVAGQGTIGYYISTEML